MNLIEESFQDKEEKQKKRTSKIILTAIIFVIALIVIIIAYLIYLQSTVMVLTMNGQTNEKMKNLLVFEEDGSVYAPIKEIAAYFGYESYNGEYTDKSEEQSKCYVISENEVANFGLGENKIYKLDLTKTNSDYECAYIKDPIKAINGVLYVSAEGLEKAFNISFDYDQEKNTITIWTLPYLYQYYASIILDYGYTELSDVFVNQKAILNNQLVVLKNENIYGVVGVDGTVILEPKYDNIIYLPATGDFLVENNKKVGIMSALKEIKVQIIYDSIELMGADVGLYVAKKDNKYGVIDLKGNIKIYIENDAIGIDISKFSQNDIKSKYVIANNLIPAKRGDYWGLFDTNGKQITEYKYDSFGYTVTGNTDAIDLLVIPNYNVLVACKDKKYTLVNSSGKELFSIIADAIYMTISGGETHYYIIANDQKIDAEDWLDANGTAINSNQTNDTNTNQNNEEQNSDDSRDNNENEEQNNNDNGNNKGNEEQNNNDNGDNNQNEQQNNDYQEQNSDDNGDDYNNQEQQNDNGNNENDYNNEE